MTRSWPSLRGLKLALPILALSSYRLEKKIIWGGHQRKKYGVDFLFCHVTFNVHPKAKVQNSKMTFINGVINNVIKKKKRAWYSFSSSIFFRTEKEEVRSFSQFINKRICTKKRGDTRMKQKRGYKVEYKDSP